MPKPCPVCGSKKWRKDAISGSAICEDGHVFQDFRSENLVAEATGYALQKRTLKKGPRRNRRKEEGNINQEYYRDDDAEYLKIQAIQLLLRLQCQALAKLWTLPEVYESIVRDLWAYQLALVDLPPPVASSGGIDETGLESLVPDLEDAKAIDLASRSDDEGSGGSKSDDSGVDTDEDVEREFMAQLSDESLREISESEAQARPTDRLAKWKRRRRLHVHDTVTILVVALWILRISFLNVDIESLINENEIPYLDFGHTNLVPTEMSKRINRDGILAISPRRAPKPLSLHKRCTAFVRTLTLRFKLSIPEFNIAPTAWRITSSLGGTPTTYNQVMRLLHTLDVNISLCPSRVENLTRQAGSRPASRNGIAREGHEVTYEMTAEYEELWPPELSVTAALVIVLKMAYGLDGLSRPAIIKADPIIGLPVYDEWSQELEERLHTGTLNESKRAMGDLDFAAMDDDDIDKYLDRCENVLLKDHDAKSDPYFPLDDTHEIVNWTRPASRHLYLHWTRSELVQPSFVSTKVANKALPPIPGENLKTYDSTDRTGTLPKDYRTLLESCAQLTGVEEEDVSRCIEIYERKLEQVRLYRLGRDKERKLSRSRSRSRSMSRPVSGKGRRRSTRIEVEDESSITQNHQIRT